MTTDLKSTLRLALLPAACAAALSACAPYDPMGTSVYTSGGPVASENPVALFDRLDTNRDGFLSPAEAAPLNLAVGAPAAPLETAAEMFRRLDTNRDSFLSRAEAGATFNNIPGASFDTVDTNRDGFISMTEATPHLQYLQSRAAAPAVMSFESLDINRDGFLSRSEAAPVMSTDRYAGPRVAPAPLISFDSLDVNRDGYLSRAEAAAIANPLTFDRYDANRDGFLSRAEADNLFRSGVGGTYGTPVGTVYGPR
jgi:Ca2+-binding EF-hand superfamily protein